MSSGLSLVLNKSQAIIPQIEEENELGIIGVKNAKREDESHLQGKYDLYLYICGR